MGVALVELLATLGGLGRRVNRGYVPTELLREPILSGSCILVRGSSISPSQLPIFNYLTSLRTASQVLRQHVIEPDLLSKLLVHSLTQTRPWDNTEHANSWRSAKATSQCSTVPSTTSEWSNKPRLIAHFMNIKSSFLRQHSHRLGRLRLGLLYVLFMSSPTPWLNH
jgi:hypothetical protein